jgi:hypothetical protein
MGNTESFGNVNSNPLVVIYETDTNNENLKKMLHLLSNNKYEYVLLGQGNKWQGFGTKILSCLEYYKTLNLERIVIQLDARDVLVNQNYDYFIKLIDKHKNIINNKLIISAEKDVIIPPAFAFPPGSFLDHNLKRLRSTYDETLQIHHQYKWNNEFNRLSNKKINKLNAGMMLGKIKNFIKVFSMLQINPKEDDQILLSELYFIKPELIHLDSDGVFFTNIAFYQNCTINGEIYHNPETNSYPVFIQTPGKNWLCYDRIFDNLN